MRKIAKLKKGVTMILSFCLISICILGCGSELKKINNEEYTKVNEENLPIATIDVQGYGTIKAKLYPNIAENTVKNFIYLVNNGFYNNLTFHRVIEDFMIQGGDPKGNGTGGPGYSIKGEFDANGIKNSIKHEDGVLSMARSNSYNSAGSQFFIMTSTSNHLDGNYAAFGKVIEGLDIVYKISKVSTDSNDRPLEDIVIQSISVDTKGINYDEPIKIN